MIHSALSTTSEIALLEFRAKLTMDNTTLADGYRFMVHPRHRL